MLPLRDNIPPQTVPVVNYLLLAVTTLVFLAQWSAGDGGEELVRRFGMYPIRVLQPEGRIVVPQEVLVETRAGIRPMVVDVEVPPAAIPPWLTLLTCIFLHGGWVHFLGNMWVLYIFGDNVEDRLGHLGYL